MKIRKNTDATDHLTKQRLLWFYCGIDAAVTRELYDEFAPTVARDCQRTYDFERAMLGPAFSMMRRGLKVDQVAVALVRKILKKKNTMMLELWQFIASDIAGVIVNPFSGPATQKLFYETLGISRVYSREGGRMRPTLNRSALEKIIKKYPRGKLLARILLALRDIKKKLDVVKTKLDPDQRLHTSFKVAGTNTWRWASSATAFRTGTNMQNISKELRRMYVPDPGYKMFYADLDQAESLAVAYVSGDENYITACESPDLHTTIAKQIWPELPWTGQLKADRKIAERPYLHGLSYRDLAKRAGHATNYGLTPGSLQKHLNLKLRDAWKFHLNYIGGVVSLSDLCRWHTQDQYGGFDLLMEASSPLDSDKNDLVHIRGAFPKIRTWQQGIYPELHQEGGLTNPFGFTRRFWGNPADHKVIREAIAFTPQSTIAILLHIGMYRVWKELNSKDVQLLCNVHDAILGQIREEVFDEVLTKVLECMSNPIPMGDRILTVPVSAEVGYNWSPVDPHKKIFYDGNPLGLGEWRERRN